MTTRGFDEDAFVHVVALIDRVLSHLGDATVEQQVRREVKDLCAQFPLYDFTVA
jgi:glycine hydroxymethyltransferase